MRPLRKDTICVLSVGAVAAPLVSKTGTFCLSAHANEKNTEKWIQSVQVKDGTLGADHIQVLEAPHTDVF